MQIRKRRQSEIPRHRLVDVTWFTVADARRRLLDASRCDLCHAHLLKTLADARSFIGLLMRTPGRWPHSDVAYTIRPYRCPHRDGYHVGLDRMIQQLFERGATHE
jgi:hypothetical protein